MALQARNRAQKAGNLDFTVRQSPGIIGHVSCWELLRSAGKVVDGRKGIMTQTARKDWWYAVSWASEVGSSPVAVKLLGEELVIWRSGGSVFAATDRCPHRGTKLSLGKVEPSGCISCPYHGWEFDGSGSCTLVPQLDRAMPIPRGVRLDTRACTEANGLIWVCLGEPAAGIPSFPEWTQQQYRHVECEPYTWRCSPERMVENFMDFGHLGYLHDGLLGSRDDLEVPKHRVERDGNELHFELTMDVPSTRDSFQVTNVRGERGKQTNTYVISAPYTIHLRSYYHDSGASRVLYFTVQPEEDGVSTGYCFQSRDFDPAGDDRRYAAFQAMLAEQDRPVVESQIPVEIPDDLRAEIHLPFDRVAVAYRRLLGAVVGRAV